MSSAITSCTEGSPCFLCRPGETSPLEREADKFAAEMLMPAHLVADFVLGMKPTEDACEYFGVSQAAWLARVNDLCETTELGEELRRRLYSREKGRLLRLQQLDAAPTTDVASAEPRVIRRRRGRVIYLYGSDKAQCPPLS